MITQNEEASMNSVIDLTKMKIKLQNIVCTFKFMIEKESSLFSCTSFTSFFPNIKAVNLTNLVRLLLRVMTSLILLSLWAPFYRQMLEQYRRVVG